MEELVTMLDDTLGIWKSEEGYYWYDQFDRTSSMKFFKNESDAIRDCQDLVYKIGV